MMGVLAGLMLGAISISVDQTGGLSARQLQLAVEEIAAIWRDAGVEVTAPPSGELSLTQAAGVSIRIVTFSIVPGGRDRPILAWVGVGPDHATLPALFVSLPAITSIIADGIYLGCPVKKLTTDVTEQLVARAVGRVAAHELGHYLLRHGGHTPRGLMRTTFSPNDLVGSSLGPFRVTEADWAAAATEILTLARSRQGLRP